MIPRLWIITCIDVLHFKYAFMIQTSYKWYDYSIEMQTMHLYIFNMLLCTWKLHQNYISKCLEAKEKSITQLNEEGEDLMEQNHPGKNVIGVITSHLLKHLQSKTSSGGCHRHHGMSFFLQCITVLHYRVVCSNYGTEKLWSDISFHIFSEHS